MRALLVAAALGLFIAGCGSSAAPKVSSTAAASAPPRETFTGTVGTAFESGECTAAAAGVTMAASITTAGQPGADLVTVTLPSGWSTQQNSSKEVVLQVGTATGAVVQVLESAIPAKGLEARLTEVYEAASAAAATSPLTKCTVAGGQASTFSEVAPSSPVVYFVILSHQGAAAAPSLYVVTVTVPADEDEAVMPEVKSILGSWRWSANQ